MKRYILLFCCSLLYSMIASAQPQNQAEKEEIANIIRKLPEVKAMDQAFDTITQRVQSVKMNIQDPTGDYPYYKVEVGYQGSNRFEIHYYFFIHQEDHSILVEDLDYGDRIYIEEWRRRRADNERIEHVSEGPRGVNKKTDTPGLESRKDIQDVYERSE